jgi:hypothetical protein
MSDRIFLALMSAACVAMIGLAAVWPQGLGARSPGPFGHIPIQQTPEMRAIMARAATAQNARRLASTQAAGAQLRRALSPAASKAGPAASSAAPAAPAGLRAGE